MNVGPPLSVVRAAWFLCGAVAGLMIAEWIGSPSFIVRGRDAQLEAAYSSGWSAAVDYNNSRDLDHALRECTDSLMRERHPETAP